MRSWLVGVLCLVTASAAVPAGWEANLPEAAGMVELPSPEVALRVDADGAIHLAGVEAPFAPDPVAPAPPALTDAIRAAVPAPLPTTRARAYVDRDAQFRSVRQAVMAVSKSRIGNLDLAGGTRGDHGFTLEMAVSNPDDPAPLPEPAEPQRLPLTLHLQEEALWLGRDVKEGILLRMRGGPERDRVLGALLDVERALHPGDRRVVVVADDPVPYGEAFTAIAETRTRDYPWTLLGGGPARPLPPPPAIPEPPDARPIRPARVGIERTGVFDIEGPALRLEASAITHFLEDCSAEPCKIAAVPAQGAPVLVGSRPSRTDPTRAWIFARPVVSAPGYARGLTAPPFEGAFSPLLRYEGSDAPETQGPASGRTILLGTLDRALIDEVLARHLNQIRYCYQRELKDDPNLTGKIVVKFTIEADGTVRTASVKSSTLGDPDVESCLLGRFRAMQFPPPNGGGIVVVSYPFVFSPR